MNYKAHLLIVDDDKELCSLLSKFMTRQGYRVSVAHNGLAMTGILEASRIDLVILDLMLPGEDGLALCWRLDVTHRQLYSAKDALVPLRAGEFDLLLAFVERPQRVLSRDQLLDLSRGRSANIFDRSIDVQISRLRRKIEPDPKEPTLIKTVRSGGYILAANVVAVPAS